MNYESNAFFKLVINDYLSNSFNPRSEPRQEDPLSPYLFNICMNVLSCMLLKAEAQKQLEGAQFNKNGPRINHLIYADDLLLFFKSST